MFQTPNNNLLIMQKPQILHHLSFALDVSPHTFFINLIHLDVDIFQACYVAIALTLSLSFRSFSNPWSPWLPWHDSGIWMRKGKERIKTVTSVQDRKHPLKINAQFGSYSWILMLLWTLISVICYISQKVFVIFSVILVFWNFMTLCLGKGVFISFSLWDMLK